MIRSVPAAATAVAPLLFPCFRWPGPSLPPPWLPLRPPLPTSARCVTFGATIASAGAIGSKLIIGTGGGAAGAGAGLPLVVGAGAGTEIDPTVLPSSRDVTAVASTAIATSTATTPATTTPAPGDRRGRSGAGGATAAAGTGLNARVARGGLLRGFVWSAHPDHGRCHLAQLLL